MSNSEMERVIKKITKDNEELKKRLDKKLDKDFFIKVEELKLKIQSYFDLLLFFLALLFTVIGFTQNNGTFRLDIESYFIIFILCAIVCLMIKKNSLTNDIEKIFGKGKSEYVWWKDWDVILLILIVIIASIKVLINCRWILYLAEGIFIVVLCLRFFPIFFKKYYDDKK